jgi:hypothetical protein
MVQSMEPRHGKKRAPGAPPIIPAAAIDGRLAFCSFLRGAFAHLGEGLDSGIIGR